MSVVVCRSRSSRRCVEEFRAQLSTLGLGLENRLSDRIGLLSGGQRQAVSLLMAALQPSRPLLDEHTAALDPRTAACAGAHGAHRERTQAHHDDGHPQHAPGAGCGGAHGDAASGAVVLDVAGKEREGLDVHHLLDMFEKVRGEKIDDDKLLLS